MWSELPSYEQAKGACSSFNCVEHPVVAFEKDGVVSVYCADCATRIERMRVRSIESNREIDELESAFGKIE